MCSTKVNLFVLLALMLTPAWSAILCDRADAGELARVYPAPAGEPLSSRFTVKVEDSSAPVYLARVVALTPEQREKVRGAVDLADTGDSAAVKNIVFEKIRIEESRRLFSLWIGKAMWSKEAERGHIDDIVFRNITSVAPGRAGFPAELVGVDAEHAIHNVEFDHLLVGGQPLQSDQVRQNGFVQDISITP